MRDRTLFKVHVDFVEAAVRGAMAVVNRQLGIVWQAPSPFGCQGCVMSVRSIVRSAHVRDIF